MCAGVKTLKLAWGNDEEQKWLADNKIGALDDMLEVKRLVGYCTVGWNGHRDRTSDFQPQKLPSSRL